MSKPHVVFMRMYGTRDLPAIVRMWYKHPGEWVSVGDQLCVVETRKATYDVISDGEGFLTQLVHVGAVVRVGYALAELSSEAEESVRSGNRS
jgi:pyruvate/2-oxoglutarate dehydrogenase complex dihydrolipoamide acyltransferase (E2) component